MIRRSPAGAARRPAADEVLDYLDASAGRGQPLDPAMRGSFERSLGVGLGGVRIVTDMAAAAAAEALGARAFTLGSTIWFGRGEYRPSALAGQRLLAHEVAHTVQQRAAAPAIQREIIVGGGDDPAEAAADRAADAMMRGDPVSPGGGATRSILRRVCTPSPGRDGNERLVTCDDGRWRVTHSRVAAPPPGRQPETQFDAHFRWNDQDVALDIWVCRGGTSFVATPSVNLPRAAMELVWNAVRGAAPGAGILLQPHLGLVLTQSESWELTLQGGPSFSAETGALESVGGSIGLRTPSYGPVTLDVRHTPATPTDPAQTGLTLTIPLERTPQRIPRIDCSRLPPARPRDVFNCQQITPGRPATPGSPPVLQTASTAIYVLFAYETAQIIGWRFEGDETIYREASQIQDRVNVLIGQGFRPSSVVGHTSPEGLRQLPRPRGRFPGNDPLSQARATAAFTAFFNDVCRGCQTYGDQPIVPRGDSELHSPPSRGGREVEGRELELHAVPSYVASDPLRPGDPAAFLRQPHDQQVAQTYNLLRRAEIRLERTPIRTPAVLPTAPQPEGLGPVVACPPAIEAAARPDFHLELLP